MHAGIAGRVFAAVGPPSRPTQIIHDGIAGAVYFAVDHGLRSAGRVGGAVASEVWGREGDQSLESWGRAAGPIAAVNGIYGDQMASHSDGLVLTMQIRRHGSAIPMTEEALATAFPEAAGRLAVFVHGWCLTERTWWRRPRTGDDARSYGDRLVDDLGFTPVYLRYNTGLHISDNGQQLADLLEQLAQLWPVPIAELALVGHSMGGLVVRSACYYGARQHHSWTAAVRHVVCLVRPIWVRTWKRPSMSPPGHWRRCPKPGQSQAFS